MERITKKQLISKLEEQGFDRTHTLRKVWEQVNGINRYGWFIATLPGKYIRNRHLVNQARFTYKILEGEYEPNTPFDYDENKSGDRYKQFSLWLKNEWDIRRRPVNALRRLATHLKSKL